MILIRSVYGTALLLAPERLLRGNADHTTRAFARVIGARLLVETALLGGRSRRRRLLAVAAVDATHAATMIALAAIAPGRRTPASISALSALLFAAAGLRAAARRGRIGRLR